MPTIIGASLIVSSTHRLSSTQGLASTLMPPVMPSGSHVLAILLRQGLGRIRAGRIGHALRTGWVVKMQVGVDDRDRAHRARWLPSARRGWWLRRETLCG